MPVEGWMKMERKKFRSYLMLGTALLAVWFLFNHLGALLGFTQTLLGIISPFLLGGALAFVLNVPMSFLETKALLWMDCTPALKKCKRPVAMVLTIVLTVLVVYLVMALVIPEIIATLETIARAVPAAVQRLDAFLKQRDISISQALSSQLQLPSGEALKAQLERMVDIALKGVVFSGTVIGSVYQNILNGFFVLMFIIYFLLGKERLSDQCKRLIRAYLPEEYVIKVLRVAGLTKRTFASFITGQCLEALILGGLFFIVLSLFKMPYVLLISVFIAVTALIPVVGAWIGCVVGAFLILVSSPMQALVFLGLFLVVQQLEGNLVYPRVMGNAIGLPSIWVLFAVVLGEGLMGVLGMLLFIPLMSVCYKLLAEAVDVRLKSRQMDPKEP